MVNTEQLNKFRKTAKHVFFNYFENSTIHGVSYIIEKGRSWWERVWWIAVFCISVLFCGKLIFDAWNISPLIIQFTAKPIPIWKIPFPAVTICPKTFFRSKHVNLTDIILREQFEVSIFNTLSDIERKELLAINMFCLQRSHLRIFENTTNCNDCLEMVRKLTIPIEDTFVECSFGDQKLNCTESFREVLIDNSICYTFNGLNVDRLTRNADESGESGEWSVDDGYKVTAGPNTYPRRALSGSQNGFSVLLRTDIRDLERICSGIPGFSLAYLMPWDKPKLLENFFLLRLGNSFTFVAKPQMMTASPELRKYPVTVRNCYFTNERTLKYYKQYTPNNCVSECAIDNVLKRCGCLPVFVENYPEIDKCGYFKSVCEGSSYFNMKNYTSCNCLPLCSKITFDSEVTLASLNKLTFSKNDSNDNKVTIYFKENQIMASQRSELYGGIDFLANCGGLLGLCLGVSVFSLLEIFYFCTVGWCVKQSSENEQVVESRPSIPSIKMMFKELLVEYLNKTTISGLKYVGDVKLMLWERVWWTIVIMISILCCGLLVSKELNRYEESPVTISYANEETLVSEIPFPAVTICPLIVATNTSKLYDYFKVQNGSLYHLDRVSIIEATLAAQICDPDMLANIDPRNETDCKECGNYLKNHFGEIDNMLFSCKGPCSKFFKELLMENGVCYTYNGLDVYRTENSTSDPTVEEWTLEGGYTNKNGNVRPQAGSKHYLDFALTYLNTKNLGPCKEMPNNGFKVFLHLPNELPQESKRYYLMPYENFVMILLNPKITTTAPELRGLSVAKRQCHFEDERYLRFFRYYTQNNCEIECVANRTLEQCGCLMFFMPQLTGIKICGIGETMCYQNVIHKSSEQKLTHYENSDCNCLPSCTSIIYETEINQHPLFGDDLGVRNSKIIAGFENSSIAQIRLNFKENQFVSRERSQLFGTIDFVANCGGLLSLFLGVSLISVLELFYFCTLRMCCSLTSKKQ